jgi:hypothetical protein
MVKAIKNGRQTTKKNITINSTPVPGSKARWKDKVSYCLLRVKFMSVAFQMDIRMDKARENGLTAMFIKAIS